MIRVYFDTDIHESIIRMYLPDGKHWKDLEITFNKDEDYDYHFIYNLPHDKPAPFITKCDPSHCMLIWIEPADVTTSIVWNPRIDVLDSVSKIVSPKKFMGKWASHANPKIVHYQQGTYWMVGVNYTNRNDVRHNIEYYRNYPHTEKKKLLSMTTSVQSYTKDQIQRQKFAHFLKDRLGDKLDLIITNRDLIDKEDTLRDYQYNITVENSSHPDYWTEKLSDPLLCNTYPIYYGCTNLNKYFDRDICTHINIYDFEGSLKKIEDTIAVPYFKRLDVIKYAHDLVINKYSLMELVRMMINNEV